VNWQFLKDRDTLGGLLLLLATALALIASNSPLSGWYDVILHTKVGLFAEHPELGEHHFGKSLLHWINEGLMAIFFLLIGLELKREMIEGQLSQVSQIILPGVAALGGVAMPALIYLGVTSQIGGPELVRGWAIPTATDIAFALGILSLLGKRVPLSLKLYLGTLAVIDDLVAILIIAFFYPTQQLSTLSMSLAGLALVAMFAMNRLGVKSLVAYLVVGALLWSFVLGSGVHATLAGVLIAFMIPLHDKPRPAPTPDSEEILHYHASPLRTLEHILHPWVAFGVLPLFAFANAGVSLGSASLDVLLGPLPLAIGLGLFLGKQLGIFGLSALLIKTGWARLPNQATWPEFYAVAVLGGIGFTMSLFIGSLAFESSHAGHIEQVRLGVLMGSALSATAGYFILRRALAKRSAD